MEAEHTKIDTGQHPISLLVGGETGFSVKHPRWAHLRKETRGTLPSFSAPLCVHIISEPQNPSLLQKRPVVTKCL